MISSIVWIDDTGTVHKGDWLPGAENGGPVPVIEYGMHVESETLMRRDYSQDADGEYVQEDFEPCSIEGMVAEIAKWNLQGV